MKKKIKEDKSKDEKDDKSDKKKKYSSFGKRFIAFIIDILIISTIASLICMPFTNTKNESKLQDQYLDSTEKYFNGDLDINAYKDIQISYTYNIAKESGLSKILTILFSILYFGLLQFYMKGQTLGKKLLHIRVISDDGELTLNQLLFRALIIDSIVLDLVLFVAMLFMNKDVYYYSVMIFELIQYIVYLVCFIMIVKNEDKKGLHDVLFHTYVVEE